MSNQVAKMRIENAIKTLNEVTEAINDGNNMIVDPVWGWDYSIVESLSSARDSIEIAERVLA